MNDASPWENGPLSAQANEIAKTRSYGQTEQENIHAQEHEQKIALENYEETMEDYIAPNVHLNAKQLKLKTWNVRHLNS